MLCKTQLNNNLVQIKETAHDIKSNLGFASGMCGVIYIKKIIRDNTVKYYNVIVNARNMNNIQSTETTYSYINIAPLVDVIKLLDPESNFLSIANDEFIVTNITKYDGSPINSDIYGYGMSLRQNADTLVLGRYYDLDGNWGAWGNNAIPPIRIVFEGVIVCQ